MSQKGIRTGFRSPDLTIRHILEDGSIEENDETERRLLLLLKIPELQLFETREMLIGRAYNLQSERIAYSAESNGEEV